MPKHIIPWAHPKRHLDRFSRYAGLTSVTDRQTDHSTRSVTTGCIYVRGRLLRSGLKIGYNKTEFMPRHTVNQNAHIDDMTLLIDIIKYHVN